MRIPGLKTLRLRTRWVRSRLTDNFLILGYHRVVDADWDPYSLCVSPQHFAEHLEVIRTHAHPLSLGDALQKLQDRTLPPNALVLTLDDGYADNLYYAKPLLERYDCPATVFVVTGAMGRQFWWHELTQIFDPSRPLPDEMVLSTNDRSYEWYLGDAAQATREGEDRRPRERLLISVSDLLRPLSDSIRRDAIEKLRFWAGKAVEPTSTARTLSPDEVVELAAGGLIEVGAHTVTHPLLSILPGPEQQCEISQSRRSLQDLLGKQITSFSYPNGMSNAETVEFVQQAGFAYACTSYPDVAWRGTNRFQLPRFWAKDEGGAAFSRWLKRWLNG